MSWSKTGTYCNGILTSLTAFTRIAAWSVAIFTCRYISEIPSAAPAYRTSAVPNDVGLNIVTARLRSCENPPSLNHPSIWASVRAPRQRKLPPLQSGQSHPETIDDHQIWAGACWVSAVFFSPGVIVTFQMTVTPLWEPSTCSSRRYFH